MQLPGRSSPPPSSPGASEEDYGLATPEEIAARQRRKRRLGWGILALTLIAVVVIAARPTVRAVKIWQARRAAAESLRLLELGKADEAVVKVQDALSLRGTDLEVMRAAAVFLTRVGHGREALAFWTQIEKARALTHDEQRDYATDLLLLGDPVAAGKRLRSAWPENTKGTPADWYLEMQLAVRGRNAGAALLPSKRLLDPQAHGVTEKQRLDAALTLLGINEPGAQSTGETALRSIADGGQSRESLEALLVLTRQASQQILLARRDHAAVPEIAFQNLLDLTARVDKHPQAKTAQRLIAIQAKMVTQPEQRARLLQETIARYGQSKDNDDVVALGAWLYAQGEFERLLEVIPPERSIGSRALYLQYLDGLGALGRWAEIRRAIEGQRFTLEPVVEHMYLARCATQLHQPETSALQWNAALLAAKTSPDRLLDLGRYALGDGAAATAEAAFSTACQTSPTDRPAHEALLGLYESQGRTRDAREAIRAMMAVWPQDSAVRNDFAYLGALLGEDLQADRDTARDLVKTEPMSLPHRITLALAEFRLGHDLTALETLRVVEPGAFAGQPRFLAVYAAILWETHYNTDARTAVQNIARDRLLPEERELIDRVKTADAPVDTTSSR